jgi:hypothetical protein
LKENAQNTRICGAHFPDGARMCRTQLHSIFPWPSVEAKKRWIIEKHNLPAKVKKRLVVSEGLSQQHTEKETVEQCEDESSVEKKYIKDIKDEIRSLKEELLKKKCAMNIEKTKPKFDID